MAAVSEVVAREYFEALGYLVIQPCKYIVHTRPKRPDEEVDLIVCHPGIKEHRVPDRLLWDTEHLKSVSRAVVAVRGWHTERFYASTFERAPDIVRFADAESVKVAARQLGTSSMAKILCLPNLPASSELREKSLNALKDKGIDGVIVFRTMLAELVSRADVHANYEKSDLMQTLRLLKNYDLLKDPQLELFPSRRRAPAEKTSGTRD